MNKKSYGYFGIFLLLLLFTLTSCSPGARSIHDKLIRFHVIANSDSTADQELKLKVRDAVLREIGPKLENAKSKEESEHILNENLNFIKSTAEKEIIRNNGNYPVSVILGKSIFPVKMYNNITLPAGQYDALKIVIGDGEGKNWWCVMFPPLCFIDITRGVTSEESENRLKTVLDTDEYDSILNSTAGDRRSGAVKKPVGVKDIEDEKESFEDTQRIEMKFKSVEAAKYLVDRIKNIGR